MGLFITILKKLNNYLQKTSTLLKKVVLPYSIFKQPAFKYSILFFLFSRIMLILIGYLTINEFHLHGIERYSCDQLSHNNLLNLFGNYDTGWYMEIAKNWYPKLSNYPLQTTFAQYNFFPLYPALIKCVHFFTGIDFFIAGILISNLCLIASATLIYKIGDFLFNPETGKIAVAFLYAGPVSFLLSGAYSESVYLFLLLFSIYSALKGRWLQAGLFGLFITLCRPIGVFIFFPLLVIYLKSINFSFAQINKKIGHLLFIPAGVLILMLLNYIYSGDALMFIHNPHYSGSLHSPFSVLAEGFANNYFTFRFLSGFTLIYILVWLIFYKHLPLALHLVILYSILIPLSYGLMSMPRMILVAFPFILLSSTISIKYKIQQPLIIACSLIQGYLAVCWFLGFGNIV